MKTLKEFLVTLVVLGWFALCWAAAAGYFAGSIALALFLGRAIGERLAVIGEFPASGDAWTVVMALAIWCCELGFFFSLCKLLGWFPAAPAQPVTSPARRPGGGHQPMAGPTNNHDGVRAMPNRGH